MNLEQARERIEHLKAASKALLEAQAVWWAAFTVAQAEGSTVPVPVRLELMTSVWHGFAPGPEVTAMLEDLAEVLTDRGWWILCCSYSEHRQATQ